MEKIQLSLFRELAIDNFAGGGGASTGIAQALGRSVDIAINHDPAAIAMHKANHPDTIHYCESVWDVDPLKVTGGRPVGLGWFSPDCKYFSKAKGGKPVNKNIRGLSWVILRWALDVRPRVIMLENVEEIQSWGPLITNTDGDEYPDPKRKGETFNGFIRMLSTGIENTHPAFIEACEFLEISTDSDKAQRLLIGLKYDVEYRELRACDFGAPTIRKRFFMVARCDGQPIVWPEPTHGDPKSEAVKKRKLKPWRTAAEIIDWSIPCPSIFERKKPLAENTMRRIARGIQKFVVENPEPFIVRIGQTGFSGDGLQYPLGRPLTTIVSKAEHCLVTPFLAQYHSYEGDGARGQVLDRPLLTQDTSNRYALVASHLIKMKGTNIGQTTDKPLQTITASGLHFGEVRAFLLKYYGTSTGQKMNEPLGTVTSRDRFGLVTVHGQDYQIVDIGMRMLEPRELFNAQGFPPDYIIDMDADGKKYPKSAQVARCGNAVPPPFAEALVRANLSELCASAVGY